MKITMKTVCNYATLALVAVAMVFASCSNDDDSAQKAAENFPQDIIGMWEGVEKTGDESNGNADDRIAYFADGIYIYFRKFADVWFPRGDEASEYSIEGSKLTSRWKAHDAADYCSEWWNIDAIQDRVMKWSASREHNDCSPYTATYTWKKLGDNLASDQLLTQISGSWTEEEMRSISLLKGEVVSIDTAAWVPQDTYTFFPDCKFWFAYPAPSESADKRVTEYTFTIKGNVISLANEKMMVDGVVLDERPMSGTYVVYPISDD